MSGIGSFTSLPSLQRPSVINLHLSKNILLKKEDSKIGLNIRSRMVNKCDIRKNNHFKNHIYLLPQDVQYTKIINTFGNPRQSLKNIKLILPMYNIRISQIENMSKTLGITKDEPFLMWVTYSIGFLINC